MAETKTKPTAVSVDDYLNAVENPVRRADGKAVDAIMRRVTGLEPQMWGPSIIGYGSYRYLYESGHGGEMCRIGYSPRKAELVLYVLSDNRPGQDEDLARLGKHKTGKCCLYIKKLADVDTDLLEKMVRDGWDDMNRRYPE